MIYWGSTGFVCLMLLISAAGYVFHQDTVKGIRDLGFPDFFRIQLAVLKVMAVPVLLLPMMPVQGKEWAYAGVALFLVTAIVAHTAHGDTFAITLLNMVFLGVLIVSNLYLPR